VQFAQPFEQIGHVGSLPRTIRHVENRIGLRGRSTAALRWPRYGCPDVETGGEFAATLIPAELVGATCELARELITGDRTAEPAGEAILKTWLSSTGTTYDKSDRRPVIPRHVVRMLSRLGGNGEARSGSVRLIRC
jgi:hypothetical protein